MDAAQLDMQAQHKRKGSALDQLEGFAPGSGKLARPSDEEAPQQDAELQQQEGQEEQPERLTDTCRLHLLKLHDSQEELLRKIDEITAAGNEILERLRRSFQERMAQVKAELNQVVAGAEAALRDESVRTLDLRERAAFASSLIGKLNIKTLDLERPATLFSAAEEAPDGGEAAAGEAAATD